MNIIVCIKRVPATDTKIKTGSDGISIDPTGVSFIVNPYDEFAIEEAVKLKEKNGAGSVTVICVGPGDAQKEIRTCLAMGADQGILLKYAGYLDAHAIAKILAKQIQSMPHEIILFGKQAVDQDNSQVGARVATLLGHACVTDVVQLNVAGQQVTASKEVEGGTEIIEASLPVVITAQKGLNEPRYASLKGIMAAKKKPLVEIEVTDAEIKTKICALTLPPDRPEPKILGEGLAAVPELIRVLREEAKLF